MKRALLAMHTAVLLWGFTGVLGRAISLDFPVLVWWRMLLTALFIAAIITYRKGWVPVAKRDLGRLILVGVLMGLHWVAFYGSIKFSNASVALVCLSTSPIFTSILDPLVNKVKWNAKELGFGALAITGVAVIAFFDKQNQQMSSLRGIGIILGVLAAFLAAVFTILNKRIASKYPARTMVFWEMTSGWAFITVALALALATSATDLLLNPGSTELAFLPRQIDLSTLFNGFPASLGLMNDWIWLVVLSLCCTVWAQSLALTALKQISSFTATLSVNLEPVYGILLAFLFYKENRELGGGFYVGVGLIVLSVALQMLSMVRQKQAVIARGGID
jgi:drug/metabolite transporter (DMT)-like permease